MKYFILSILLFISVSVQAQLRSPYLHYSFDNTLIDSALTGLNLTANGDATFTAATKAVGSHSGYVQGSNDYFKTPTIALGNTFLVSMWVYHINSIAANRYVFADSDSDNFVNNIDLKFRFIATDNFRVYTGSSSSNPSFTTTEDNWHHLVVWTDRRTTNSVTRVWWDGTRSSQTDSTILLDFGRTSRFVMGCDNYLNGDWTGYIDEVRIYKNLTPTELQIDSLNALTYNEPEEGVEPPAYDPPQFVPSYGLLRKRPTYQASTVLSDYTKYMTYGSSPNITPYLSHDQYMVTYKGAYEDDIVGVFDPWYPTEDTITGVFNYSLIDDEGGAYKIHLTSGKIRIADSTLLMPGLNVLTVRTTVGSLIADNYVYVMVKSEDDCYFIDPDAVSSGSGTRASPLNTWVGITFQEVKAYFQKRNTEYSTQIVVDESGTDGNEIYISAYGGWDGDTIRPEFSVNSTTSGITVKGSYIVLQELYFTNNINGVYVANNRDVLGYGEIYTNIMISDCEFYANHSPNGQLNISRNTGVTQWEVYFDQFIEVYDVTCRGSLHGYGMKVESGGHDVFRNMKIYDNFSQGISITYGTWYHELSGILAYDNGGNGVELSGRYHELSYSIIRAVTDRNPIQVSDPESAHSWFHHNLIEDGGYRGGIALHCYNTGSYTGGFNQRGYDFLIEDNTIKTITESYYKAPAGIRIGGSVSGVVIRRNVISDNSHGIRMAVYATATPTYRSHHIEIYNNVFTGNVLADIIADTILSFYPSGTLVDSVYIYNNTMTHGVNLTNAAAPKIVRNNYFDRLVSLTGVLTASNNIDLDTITKSLHFVTYDSNLRLKSTATSAINNGYIMTLFDDDILGIKRDDIDIGAYEYVP